MIGPSRISYWLAFALPAALAIGCLSSGCSAKPVSSEDETTTDLRAIARAYEVVTAASNRPPRELDQIKKVLADLHTDGLIADAPLDVLTSSRDGQPYVIILGADLGASLSDEILVYEKNGAEGKRYVFLMNYEIPQMTDEQFGKAAFARGHKPNETATPAASP